MPNDTTQYDHLALWASNQRWGRSARYLRVGDGTIDDDVEESLLGYEKAVGKSETFHYRDWRAQAPLQFEPDIGTYWFIWRRNAFRLIRQPCLTKRDYDQEPAHEIIISCLGWNHGPIRKLIEEADRWAKSRNGEQTDVYHAKLDAPGNGGDAYWRQLTSRPSRPLETVDLPKQQKAELISGLDNFLRASKRSWYARRGIPYRRGYLFSGPPGTGKSSLSFALAGRFGLDMYMISLEDTRFNEGDFQRLFSELPPRCIVMIEDVDAAGMVMDRSDGATTPAAKTAPTLLVNGAATPGESDDGKSDISVSTPASPTAKHHDTSAGGEEKKGISLSALLNLIDGVASHEGHILVMTSNYIDHLDKALMRPGRVDKHVIFTNAKRTQIRDLFVRMYSADDEESTYSPFNSNQSDKKDVDADLEKDAELFAEQFPEEQFSPAEIQGFLLFRVEDRSKALKEVGAWIEGRMGEKRTEKTLAGV